MTLRRQIAATVAVVSCLVALTVGLLVHRASVRQHTDQARKAAETALTAMLDLYDRTGDLAGWNSAQDSADLPDPLRRLAQRGHRGSMLGPGPNGTAMWAAAGTGGKVLSVRVDYADDERAIADLDRAILVAVAASVFVTVLAGILVADRISSRLRTAARSARTIAGGDFTARIGPLGRTRDEVTELAAAVDSMSAALHRRLRNEQRFTADVAHELRTPLTGLVTAAELLPPGRPTQLVRDRVRALHRLVEDLLEVSRLDAHAVAPDLADVRLGETVRRIVGATGLDVELRIVSDTVVTTDPRRLDRVVSNLVVNAHRHGAPPVEVVVEAAAAGPVITVRDHGPGYPEPLLRDGPQRFRTGAEARGRGHGLGLTIAEGHAAALGVGMEYANAPGGGARTVLRLPRQPGPSAP
ncbi:sensor histidine kinase [Peterkaempfera bronchialis]|uniref:histidine kinase n=1 Tax=Peterkaempfera bronchialis TaxID=2126346 RepID=A0A345T2Q3_9ACTN|nr:HAMP domain-containing sensor histidine kinase [Peterkaempfera bronchialis]AXI80258.1 sensor histidine kinase [Peterkaempfera bronchialis]